MSVKQGDATVVDAPGRLLLLAAIFGCFYAFYVYVIPLPLMRLWLVPCAALLGAGCGAWFARRELRSSHTRTPGSGRRAASRSRTGLLGSAGVGIILAQALSDEGLAWFALALFWLTVAIAARSAFFRRDVADR